MRNWLEVKAGTGNMIKQIFTTNSFATLARGIIMVN